MKSYLMDIPPVLKATSFSREPTYMEMNQLQTFLLVIPTCRNLQFLLELQLPALLTAKLQLKGDNWFGETANFPRFPSTM